MSVILCVALGWAAATQIRLTDRGDAYSSMRSADLLVVLDGLNREENRVRQEISDLSRSVAELERAEPGSTRVLDEAGERLAAAEIRAGTAAAVGPGVVVRIDQGEVAVDSILVVDVIQELRAAGAEAIQISGSSADGDEDTAVRVVVSTWGRNGGDADLVIDGTAFRGRLTVTAIGDAPTLATALGIPGGVVDTVKRAGGSVEVGERDEVRVSATR